MAQEETGMDQDKLDELRELVDFLKANGIAEFDMERTDLKVRIKFAGAAGASAADLALAQQLIAGGGGGNVPSLGAPAAAAAAAAAVPADVSKYPTRNPRWISRTFTGPARRGCFGPPALYQPCLSRSRVICAT